MTIVPRRPAGAGCPPANAPLAEAAADGGVGDRRAARPPPRRADHVTATSTQGRVFLTIVRKWLFKPLFDAVNGGLRLAEGRTALFSPTMYASLYSLLQKMILLEGSSSSASHALGRRSPAASSGPPIDMRAVQAEELARNMTEVVVPALAACQGTALFDEFKRRWEDHKTITEWTRRLFKALDAETVRVKADTLTSHSIKLFKEFAFDKRKGSIGFDRIGWLKLRLRRKDCISRNYNSKPRRQICIELDVAVDAVNRRFLQLKVDHRKALTHGNLNRLSAQFI